MKQEHWFARAIASVRDAGGSLATLRTQVWKKSLDGWINHVGLDEFWNKNAALHQPPLRAHNTAVSDIPLIARRLDLGACNDNS